MNFMSDWLTACKDRRANRHVDIKAKDSRVCASYSDCEVICGYIKCNVVVDLDGLQL